MHQPKLVSAMLMKEFPLDIYVLYVYASMNSSSSNARISFGKKDLGFDTIIFKPCLVLGLLAVQK